jgi:hypothetical protein
VQGQQWHRRKEAARPKGRLGALLAHPGHRVLPMRGQQCTAGRRADRPTRMGRASLAVAPCDGDDDVVILTRHGGRLRLEAWADHLEQHEVTRAPHRVDGKVIWLAPWAGIFDPGYTRSEVPTETPGLWAALASAVGSGATADS